MFNVLYYKRYSKLNPEIAGLDWTHNFSTREINIQRLPRAQLHKCDRIRVLFAATKEQIIKNPKYGFVN